MRRILFIILILAAAGSAFSSPLVFSAEKTIKANGNTDIELATFDSSKYKDVRIGVSLSNSAIDKFGTFVYVHALENDNLMFIGSISLSKDSPSRTAEFENLPRITRFTARVSGTYQIYVWASQ